MGKNTTTVDHTGKTEKVLIIPRWRYRFKYARSFTPVGRIPGNSKSVSIEWLFALFALIALNDYRMYWLRDQ
jgi:hypothetical protein